MEGRILGNFFFSFENARRKEEEEKQEREFDGESVIVERQGWGGWKSGVTRKEEE